MATSSPVTPFTATSRTPKDMAAGMAVSAPVSPSKSAIHADPGLAISETPTPRLPPDLEDAIARILGEPTSESTTSNALESSSFDPVQFINAAFPNEQSLAHLDRLLVKLRKKIRRMDDEIRELVRTQTESGLAAVEELKEVKNAIESLHARIKRIKERAGQSEEMVQEITKDIKSLDYAKRNLTTSITMLRRLQMLVSAVGQLSVMTSKRQYRETAQLLQAILQLLSHFRAYKSIRFVSDIFDQVDAMQLDLKRRIMNEFEGAFLSQNTLRNSVGVLNEACQLAEVIERDNPKRQLIDWYCDRELKDYRSIFRGNDEVAALDNTSRRYAWLRRELKTHDDEHASIFPQSWRVAEILCEQFADDTRKDLVDVLAKDNARNALDVKLMLQTLQQTIDFENRLDRRFAGKDPDRISMDRRSEDQSRRSEDTSSGIPSKFVRRISAAFEPYLDHYIAAEDKNLADIMDTYRAKPVAEDDPSISVLSSSTDLFYFYRQTLVHCSKMSTGQPFLNLTRMFAKYLRVYADLLMSKLPRDDKAALNEASARDVCLVLNTADYCHVTSAQLEDKLKEKIDPALADKVDMTAERDIFLNVANACISALVRGVENALEPAWQVMTTRIPWNTITNTGDQSEYVFVIATAIQTNVPVIKRTLTASKYFRLVCDRLAESTFAKFYTCIFRCRVISEIGAEQMLIDVNAVSSIFANLPRTDGDRDSNIPAAYTKILSKGVSKCETFLKVVMNPAEPFEGLVSTYLTLMGAEANAAMFTRILDMKGIPRANQGAAIDIFNRRAVGLAGASNAPLPPPPPTPVSPLLVAPVPGTPVASTAATAASAASAVLQGALSSSVSAAGQLASAAQKSSTVTSFSSGLKNWMNNMGRTSIGTAPTPPPGGTPISGTTAIGGTVSVAAATAAPAPPGSPTPKAVAAGAAGATTSAFAKMAALGQNFLSSAKPSASSVPPPPPPKG